MFERTRIERNETTVSIVAALSLVSLFPLPAQVQTPQGDLPRAAVPAHEQDPSRVPYTAELATVDYINNDGQLLRKVPLYSGAGDPAISLRRVVHGPIGASKVIENAREIFLSVTSRLEEAEAAVGNGESQERRKFVRFDETIILSSQSFREISAPEALIRATGWRANEFRVDLIPIQDGLVVYSKNGEVVAVVDLPAEALKNNPDEVTLRGIIIPGTQAELTDGSSVTREIVTDTATCKQIRASTVYQLRMGVVEKILTEYESRLGKKIRDMSELSIEDRKKLVSMIEREISVITRGAAPGSHIAQTLAATEVLEGMIAAFIADRNRILDLQAAAGSPEVAQSGTSRGQAVATTDTRQASDSDRQDTRNESESTKVDTSGKQTTNSIGAEVGFSIFGVGVGVSANHTATESESTQTGSRELHGTASSNVKMRGFVYTQGEMRGRDVVASAEYSNQGRSLLRGLFLKELTIEDFKNSRFMTGAVSLAFNEVYALTHGDLIQDRESKFAEVMSLKNEIGPKMLELAEYRDLKRRLDDLASGKESPPTRLEADPEYDLLFLEQGKRIPFTLVQRFYKGKGQTVSTVCTLHELEYLKDLLERSIKFRREADQYKEQIVKAISGVLNDISNSTESPQGIDNRRTKAKAIVSEWSERQRRIRRGL